VHPAWKGNQGVDKGRLRISPQRQVALKAWGLRDNFALARAARSPGRIAEPDMEKILTAAGALSAFIGVAAGAFGAHGLKARLTPDMLAIFEVGVRYQMYHAFALLACAWAASRWPGGLAGPAGIAFMAGTVIFSGSLYVLALTGVRWLGAITPLGGLAFLVGWACLAWTAWRAQ
jgi:uncharacterized membrane protein YgdD (TMEM256/DUF423 family)